MQPEAARGLVNMTAVSVLLPRLPPGTGLCLHTNCRHTPGGLAAEELMTE